jgi:hypothetical protein
VNCSSYYPQQKTKRKGNCRIYYVKSTENWYFFSVAFAKIQTESQISREKKATPAEIFMCF